MSGGISSSVEEGEYPRGPMRILRQFAPEIIYVWMEKKNPESPRYSCPEKSHVQIDEKTYKNAERIVRETGSKILYQNAFPMQMGIEQHHFEECLVRTFEEERTMGESYHYMGISTEEKLSKIEKVAIMLVLPFPFAQSSKSL